MLYCGHLYILSGVLAQPGLTWLGLSKILGRAKAFKKGLAQLRPWPDLDLPTHI